MTRGVRYRIGPPEPPRDGQPHRKWIPDWHWQDDMITFGPGDPEVFSGRDDDVRGSFVIDMSPAGRARIPAEMRARWEQQIGRERDATMAAKVPSLLDLLDALDV